MAAIQNERDKQLQATVPRIQPYEIDPSTVPGLKAVELSADSLTFKIPNVGSVTPGTITLTANLRGLTGAATFTVTDGVATLAGSGATRTLAYADMASDSVTIRASFVDGATTYEKFVTLSKVRDGVPGSPGATGQGHYIAYRAYSVGATPTAPANTTSGAVPAGWSATPITSLSTGQQQMQTDGFLLAGTTVTVWNTPYPSYAKFGSLEAIVAYTGNIIVDSGGSVRSDGKTSYASGTAGFWLGYDSTAYKFNIGDSTYYMKWTGSTLDVRSNGSAIFSGSSSAPSGFGTAALVGVGSGSLGGLLGEASTSNASAIGVMGYGYNGGYFQAANSGGIGVSAVNNQSGGVGLYVVGRFNWAGITWPAPNVAPASGSVDYVLRANGTWGYPTIAIDSQRLGGYTLAEISSATDIIVEGKLTSYIKRSGATFSLYIPSLGATYTNCQVF